MWGWFFTDGQENSPLQTKKLIETIFSLRRNASVSLIGSDPAAFPKQLNSYGYPEVSIAQFFSTVTYQDLTSCMKYS